MILQEPFFCSGRVSILADLISIVGFIVRIAQYWLMVKLRFLPLDIPSMAVIQYTLSVIGSFLRL